MQLTQQEFATRLGVAIRTVARWEKDQPPHGQILAKLAQIADARELKEVARFFVAELRTEKTSHYASTEPELKAWAAGLEIAFRFRFANWAQQGWLQIAQKIAETVGFAASGEEEAGDQKSREFLDLHRQLDGALDRYRLGGPN